MGSNKPGIRVINYAAAAAALVLCSEVSHADQGGSSFWFPGQFASSRRRAADTRLGAQCHRLPFQRRRSGERCCGQRDPGRQNPRERQR